MVGRREKEADLGVLDGSLPKRQRTAKDRAVKLHGGQQPSLEDDSGLAASAAAAVVIGKFDKHGRLVWTPDLHDVFLQAIEGEGVDLVRPKRIQQRMSVRGLTLDHIKSHLQKYRSCVNLARKHRSTAGVAMRLIRGLDNSQLNEALRAWPHLSVFDAADRISRQQPQQPQAHLQDHHQHQRHHQQASCQSPQPAQGEAGVLFPSQPQPQPQPEQQSPRYGQQPVPEVLPMNDSLWSLQKSAMERCLLEQRQLRPSKEEEEEEVVVVVEEEERNEGNEGNEGDEEGGEEGVCGAPPSTNAQQGLAAEGPDYQTASDGSSGSQEQGQSPLPLPSPSSPDRPVQEHAPPRPNASGLGDCSGQVERAAKQAEHLPVLPLHRACLGYSSIAPSPPTTQHMSVSAHVAETPPTCPNVGHPPRPNGGVQLLPPPARSHCTALEPEPKLELEPEPEPEQRGVADAARSRVAGPASPIASAQSPPSHRGTAEIVALMCNVVSQLQDAVSDLGHLVQALEQSFETPPSA